MEVLQSLFMNIIPFVVVLSVLVYFHEMGHYVIARMNGVRVETFSIGFGPEIFGWNNKHGTRWKVSYIPLGGYVSLASEDEVEGTKSSRADSGSMMSKTPWQRIAISLGGPAANYILAIILFTGLYVTVGQKVPLNEVEFGDVAVESPAQKAGLEKGDVLLNIEGVDVMSIGAFQEKVSKSADQPLSFRIRRGEEEQTILVVPESLKDDKSAAKIGVMISPRVEMKIHGIIDAVKYAVVDTWNMTVQTLKYLGQMIAGERSSDGLSGPIGIANVAGQVAQQGVVALIWLGAILSINLGLINLFPVPMLDGGHVVFYIIEIIRGKPLPEKALEFFYRIGFALVMSLILYSTWNDLSRLKVVQFVQNLFGF